MLFMQPDQSIIIQAPGTPICRTSASDVALSMAQRLGEFFMMCYAYVQRFHPFSPQLAWFKKQIFLSVDISPTFALSGQMSQVAVEMERRAFGLLRRSRTRDAASCRTA